MWVSVLSPLALLALANSTVRGTPAKATTSHDLDNIPLASSCQVNEHPNVKDLTGTEYVSKVTSAKLPNGRTYRFVWYRTPIESKKPTLLFLHGFPSTSYDWRRQFQYFADEGYGMIAPDLLGYGGTDKPTDLDNYRLRPMAEDLASLLDCLGVSKVVTVSHDWGSLLNSRFITYHPERISATAFLDIGYFAPPLAIGGGAAKTANLATSLTLGYPIFGYWLFFNESESTGLMDAHAMSAASLIYANDPKLQSKNFCDGTALQAWLSGNKSAPSSPWLPASELQTFQNIISSNGGYAAPLNWYKAIVRDINTADEEYAASTEETAIKVPTLLVTATKDPIGLPSFARLTTRPYAGNLTERSVEAGHFVMLERAGEVNAYLGEWLAGLGS